VPRDGVPEKGMRPFGAQPCDDFTIEFSYHHRMPAIAEMLRHLTADATISDQDRVTAPLFIGRG
jgi:hypothetical protein